MWDSFHLTAALSPHHNLDHWLHSGPPESQSTSFLCVCLHGNMGFNYNCMHHYNMCGIVYFFAVCVQCVCVIWLSHGSLGRAKVGWVAMRWVWMKWMSEHGNPLSCSSICSACMEYQEVIGTLKCMCDRIGDKSYSKMQPTNTLKRLTRKEKSSQSTDTFLHTMTHLWATDGRVKGLGLPEVPERPGATSLEPNLIFLLLFTFSFPVDMTLIHHLQTGSQLCSH